MQDDESEAAPAERVSKPPLKSKMRKYLLATLHFVQRLPVPWRAILIRGINFVALVAIATLVVFQLIKWFVPEERLWAADNLDLIVTRGLGLIAIVVVVWGFISLLPESEFFKRARDGLMSLATALLVILTVFAGYASFRNQSRLSSEAALNDAGYTLYNLEMEKTELRCLYFNYGHSSPDQCLSAIVNDPQFWSLAIFYVEESWFQLEGAKKEQDEWGATYAESIKYWAQDVGRDPTGLFSYYLVSSEKSIEKAVGTMLSSGVEIDGMCAKYRKVWRALYKVGKHPPMVSGAGKYCARLSAPEKTILALPELPIRDEEEVVESHRGWPWDSAKENGTVYVFPGYRG